MISDYNALYSVQLPLLIHGAHRANQYAQEVMQKFQEWSKNTKNHLIEHCDKAFNVKNKPFIWSTILNG